MNFIHMVFSFMNIPKKKKKTLSAVYSVVELKEHVEMTASYRGLS